MDKNLEVFAAIGTMIEDIVTTQGKEPIQLELYRRLVEMTGPTATKAMQQHIDAFTTWFESNRDAILEKDHTNISRTSYIAYNDKVYLPMRLILDRSTPEDRNTIWLHIISIRVKSHPESIDDFKKLMGKNAPTPEGLSFIDGMMKKIESEMSKIANTVDNHEHHLDPIKTIEKCNTEECTEHRSYECGDGCNWGLCEICFDTHKKDVITDETTPLEAIEKLAAGGGFSRLMKDFSDKAGQGGINPMELMGSLQGYSEKNGGPNMGGMMSGMMGGAKKGGSKVEDMF
jgi:hypothetical protein